MSSYAIFVMDGHAAMMGHWAPPSPSLKQFFSSYLEGDEQVSLGSMPQMPAEATNASSSVGAHQGISFEDNDPREGGNSFDNHMIFTPVPGQKSTSRGGLADRIAARAGFNASCLNTGSIRLTVQSSSGVKSPYLTIPSSISPTSLLESPVFISNSLTQASPTTGKLPLFLDGNGKVFTAPTNGQNKEDAFDDVNDSSSFAFKPHAEPGLPFSHCIANKVLPNIEVSVRSENNLCNFEPSQVSSHEGLSEPLTDKKHVERNAGSELRSLDTIGGTAEQPPPLSGQNEDEGKQSIVGDSISGGSTDVFADDGYNWRKYGQKQVKRSEFPRSYYKCTYMSCPVKKKVERSVEGHITEIIYRGIHNHPEPAPNRRSSIGSNQLDANHGQVAPENGCDRESFWGASQNGVLPGTREWRNDSLAHNSLTPMSTEIRRLSSSLHMQNGAVVESGDVMDPSSAISCDEEGADPGTHGSVSVANDVEGDESESKRRKLETYAAEVGSGATRAIREPRVVVQTTSDVDILDDGYRWRKYGQKVVKGNPNPRSYYKCTSIGCSVRKHVERASNDLKSVITTYEGKHNHDVPTARNSSHVNSSSYAALGSQGPGFIPRPEQAQVTNMERYASASHLSSFNMPMMQPLGPPPQGFPMGMNQSSSVNLSTAGMGPGHTKLPGMTTHPCLIQQQPRPENDMSFMIPNSNPNLYLSDGSSVDHQNMNRQPLGP